MNTLNANLFPYFYTIFIGDTSGVMILLELTTA